MVLGICVRYTDTKGHTKLAKVLADTTTVTEGTDLPGLNEGQFHILVFSPSGRIYNKFSIPDATVLTPEAASNYQNEGALVGVIQPL